MVIYSREKVARLREQYPAGTRICLNSMDGEGKNLRLQWMMISILLMRYPQFLSM